jgi:hypothetical protein
MSVSALSGQVNNVLFSFTDPARRTVTIDSCDGFHIGFFDVTVTGFITADFAVGNVPVDQQFMVEAKMPDPEISPA